MLNSGGLSTRHTGVYCKRGWKDEWMKKMHRRTHNTTCKRDYKVDMDDHRLVLELGGTCPTEATDFQFHFPLVCRSLDTGGRTADPWKHWIHAQFDRRMHSCSGRTRWLPTPANNIQSRTGGWAAEPTTCSFPFSRSQMRRATWEHRGWKCEKVSERKGAETQPLVGTQSKKSEIPPETTIPNHLDIRISYSFKKSKSYSFSQITASLQFNFFQYPKNIGEKCNPRPA